MTFTHRDALSVFELIFYVPSIIIAAFVAIRHGFGKNLGWIYLVIFSLVRLVGAGAELGEKGSKPSTAAIICQTIGLSPLILTCIGLLSRANTSSSSRSSKEPVHPLLFRLTTVLCTVALILSIIGGTSSSSTTGPNPSVNSKTKIGVILFIFCYLGLVFILMWLSLRLHSVTERRLVVAVGISAPLILVRLVYSILSAFAHSRHFNPVTGSVAIEVAMATLEEVLVVVTCLVTGLTLDSKGTDTAVAVSAAGWAGQPGRRGGQGV